MPDRPQLSFFYSTATQIGSVTSHPGTMLIPNQAPAAALCNLTLTPPSVLRTNQPGHGESHLIILVTKDLPSEAFPANALLTS